MLENRNQRVWQYLHTHGASFFSQIASDLQMLKVELERCIAELVSSGLVTSDSFNGLRALLVPGKFKVTHSRKSKHNVFSIEEAGRWALIQQEQEQAQETESKSQSESKHQEAKNVGSDQEISPDEMMELARVLLRRYGVIFRKLVDREKALPPWREFVRVFRLMEARGQIRGGRFVTGVWGEQFALKEAVTKLRAVVKKPKTGELIKVCAADPLNLTSIVTPGGRVSGLIHNRILYLDGEPVAIKTGKDVTFIKTPEKIEKWTWQNALVQRVVSPKLRPYLGKGIV